MDRAAMIRSLLLTVAALGAALPAAAQTPSIESITESATCGGLSASASVHLRVHEFMGGVRFSSRANPTVVPFGQFLVGAITGSAKLTASGGVVGSPGFSFSREASGTDIALQAGGGMQVRPADKFAVRVGADYIRILAVEGVNAFRFGAGVVLAR